MDNGIHDVIIIGGGPGGYTAALYAARAGFDTLVVERYSAGGQMALTEQIDNYPGFDEGIEGFTLGERMQRGAERFGAVTLTAEVRAVRLGGEVKELDTGEGTLRARAVVICTGTSPKWLGLPGERELVGRGVHTCATCDGWAYRGKTVAVIGGGNSAAGDALTLARVARQVILVHRRDTLRATRVYSRPLEEAGNVAFRWNCVVSELRRDGEGRFAGLTLRDVRTGEEHALDCDGAFVSIGRTPATALFRDELALDAQGYLIADESTRTNVPGVFAVGDVRTKVLRQVVTAVADGAMAAFGVEEHLLGRGIG